MAGSILGALVLLIKTKGDVSGLTKTDRALKKTTREMSALGSLGRKVFAGLGAFLGVKSYLEFEKSLGAIHSRFYAITQDNQKAIDEFNYVRKIAKETALDIESTAESYSIFYASAHKALGTEGVRGVFDNWTKVGRVLHLSPYQMERVTYALREMVSKGAIYSQDLRMQIGTHVPQAMGLAQKAAEELGITGTGWFEKLQDAAKGNAQLTAKFVQLFSKNAEKAFASPEALKEALRKPDALLQSLANFRTEFLIRFSEAGGGYMTVKILEGILNLVSKIDFETVTRVLGDTARFMANIFGFLTEHFSKIIWLLRIIAITYGVKRIGEWWKFISVMSKKIIHDIFKAINVPLGLLFSHIFRNTFTPNKASIISGLVRALGKSNVIGKIAISLVRLSNPITAILSIIALFIPWGKLFTGIYNWVTGKRDIAKRWAETPLARYGMTPNDALNLLNSLKNNKNIVDQASLTKKVIELGYGKIAGQFVYNGGDINIWGVGTSDEIKEVAETLKDKDQKNANKNFNNPSTKWNGFKTTI